MEIAVLFAAFIVIAVVIAPILYFAFRWKQPEKPKKRKWKQCEKCKKWSET
jgi:uncharacterized membrane protein YciS (DUF1049 family)